MDIQPDIVINTAAYHKVDEVEDNPEKAFLINSIAQKNLSELCELNTWTLVYMSTDYVFGSNTARMTPYSEADKVGPINMYGVSKFAGEKATQNICERHFVIRTSGLYGTAGSSGKGGNFVELMLRLGKERGEVHVVNDQIQSPTYTKNLTENMKELLLTKSYGLYHMTSMGSCSWWEFAIEIFKQMSMNVQCTAVTSDFFKTKAKRPHYSVLEKAHLHAIGLNKMKDWKENLHNYLIEKGYL